MANVTDVKDAPVVDNEDEELTTPWHFKLLLIALVLYLIFRFVQMSIWAYHWAF